MILDFTGTFDKALPQPHPGIINFIVISDDDKCKIRCTCYGEKITLLDKVRSGMKLKITAKLIAEMYNVTHI